MLTQRSDVMLSEVEASKNHIKIDPSYRQDDNFAKTNLGSTSILLPFFIGIKCHPEPCEGSLIAGTVSIQNNSRPPEIDDTHTNKKRCKSFLSCIALYYRGHYLNTIHVYTLSHDFSQAVLRQCLCHLLYYKGTSRNSGCPI